jgi:Zn2+/Cd2+-exporting ATPase
MMKPYYFDEFFSSGQEESISPFLTEASRPWGANISLRSSGIATLFFALSFGLSFVSPPLSYVCLTFVYFLAGTPALIASLNDLKNLEINIDVLMTLAAFLAVAIGSSLEGALLLVLFELSHSMEQTVSNKARGALHNLNNIAPKFAHIVSSDGLTYEKRLSEVSIGDKVLVKNGEIVPLDGVVVEGISSITQVHLTGESLPLPLSVGDSIPAGARNLEAALVIEVNRTSSDSTLSRIIQLITAASEAKPKLQRWLDHFGKRYATTIITLTFLFALFLPFFFSIGYLGIEGSIYRALAFLIAASPCALIIATPTAYLSAISACARRGILLKGGVILDALAACKVIAFDKTGTLTTGELQCTKIERENGSTYSDEQAIAIAAGLERNVVHPIATAVGKLADEKGIQPAEISSFKTVPGSHLEGTYRGVFVSIGLPKKQPLDRETEILASLQVGEGHFLFHFSDQLRKETPDLIQKIKSENHLRPIMLTGDNAINANRIGKLIELDDVYANLRPEDKLKKVADLSQEGLAMVGDGINDAPALARATVGISMGCIGSATAVDASDVVLLNDDLSLVSWLFSKAKHTEKIVKQNLTLALAVILFATTPALLGWVPLWIAVILHEGGTVLVGLNSLRLFKD